jgi:hypothetical protein
MGRSDIFSLRSGKTQEPHYPEYVPPKRRVLLLQPYGVMSQKTESFIVAAVTKISHKTLVFDLIYQTIHYMPEHNHLETELQVQASTLYLLASTLSHTPSITL